MESVNEARFTREQMIEALRALDGECARRGVAGEICIYGGAEMVLLFDARPATRDVDAVFRPKAEIYEAARIVASQLNLPPDWLNDGVKGFLSHNEELREEPILELEQLSHLRVFFPTAEYLLAMKCLAARSEETSQDRRDVEFLIRAAELHSEEEVFAVIGRFYPLDQLHVRTRYFVSEVIAELDRLPQHGSER